MPGKNQRGKVRRWKQTLDIFFENQERWDKVVYIIAAMLVAVSVSVIIRANGTQLATAPMNVLQGKTIVLDAGHGGMDAGALSRDQKVRESDLNLNITQQLEKMLTARGVNVVMTRATPDALGKGKRSDMEERRKIIGQPGVDVMVSIHMNSNTDSSASGPMVYYYNENTKGKVLAECLEKMLCEVLQPEKQRGARAGDFFVLRAGEAPSALVECGFLSNSTDARQLQDPAYQQRIVEAIVMGLENYFNSGGAV